MAVDARMIERLRAPLAGRRTIAEKAMFGGVCFMLRDHMLCGCGSGGFMFRVGAEQEAQALARPGATRVEMGGRPFRGFVWVDPRRCKDKDLPGWIRLAENYVGALPPKGKAKPRAAKKRTALARGAARKTAARRKKG